MRPISRRAHAGHKDHDLLYVGSLWGRGDKLRLVPGATEFVGYLPKPTRQEYREEGEEGGVDSQRLPSGRGVIVRAFIVVDRILPRAPSSTNVEPPRRIAEEVSIDLANVPTPKSQALHLDRIDRRVVDPVDPLKVESDRQHVPIARSGSNERVPCLLPRPLVSGIRNHLPMERMSAR